MKRSVSAGPESSRQNSSALLPTLLVVSASEQAHAGVSRVLAPLRWRVSSAYSGQEAAELLTSTDIAVVLCDCELSEGGWRSLLDRALAAQRPSRLIVFCRFADVRLWAEALNLGAWDVLTYPFETQELIRGTAVAWNSWDHDGRWRSKPS